MSISILIWLPLGIALALTLVPTRLVGRAAAVLSLLPLGVAIDYMARFHAGTPGPQFVTDRMWISALGIHYKLGLTGLNMTLVLLTCVLFTASLAWAALRDVPRPHLFFFQLGLAQSAVLGAFTAQDLILFIAFFDLMLIPFYFLLGTWGTGDRVKATIQMVTYTAAGSFLMLAGAIAAGVLAAHDHHAAINFTYQALEREPLARGSQDWIFICFAVAFLVKMPLVPFHGWMREAYKSMPIPAVAVFSGVLSKVAAYGFLAIVLPIFPAASEHFQMVMLVLCLVSIVWGTAVAFTTRDARLVITYSSVAQLGFITLGIFSLRERGAQGALLQMLNHGLVTAAGFFIVAALAARAGDSESIDDMGGIAFRAPVLATAFVIISLATLAMPGSPNFIGEFMVLLGTFDAKLAVAAIAFVGVAGAAVYALRLFIRTMHNHLRQGVQSIELGWREAVAIVPLTLIVLVLAFFPQFGLSRSQNSVNSAVAALTSSAAPGATVASARAPVTGTAGRVTGTANRFTGTAGRFAGTAGRVTSTANRVTGTDGREPKAR